MEIKNAHIDYHLREIRAHAISIQNRKPYTSKKAIMRNMEQQVAELYNAMHSDDEPINEMNEVLENLGVTCLYALISSYDNCIED